MQNNQKIIDKWLEYLEIDLNRSPATIRKYGDCMGLFARYMTDSKNAVPNATVDELRRFVGMYLHSRGTTPKTRSIYLCSLRSFYSWVKLIGVRDDDPSLQVRQPNTGYKLPRSMETWQAEKMLSMPDYNTFKGVRDGAIMSILLGCGLRASGVANLNESCLIEEPDKDGSGYLDLYMKVLEKGDRERIVFVPENAQNMLRAYMGHPALQEYDRDIGIGDRVLFVSMGRNCPIYDYHGEATRISRRGVYQVIQHYGKMAGIDERVLHPHAMRHLFGTQLAESGADLHVIKEAMGHKSVRSTEIYIRLAKHKLREALEKGSPIQRINTPVSSLQRPRKGETEND